MVALVAGELVYPPAGGQKTRFAMPGLGIEFFVFDGEFILDLVLSDTGEALIHAAIARQWNLRFFLERMKISGLYRQGIAIPVANRLAEHGLDSLHVMLLIELDDPRVADHFIAQHHNSLRSG